MTAQSPRPYTRPNIATDPILIERAAEAIHAQLCKRNGIDFPWASLDPDRRKDFRDDVRAVLSAIPEAVEQERELIKRAYLGVSVLRTMLQKEGMRLGVQAADDLMADMASLMPELPGTLALRARTTEQKGDRHD